MRYDISSSVNHGAASPKILWHFLELDFLRAAQRDIRVYRHRTRANGCMACYHPRPIRILVPTRSVSTISTHGTKRSSVPVTRRSAAPTMSVFPVRGVLPLPPSVSLNSAVQSTSSTRFMSRDGEIDIDVSAPSLNKFTCYVHYCFGCTKACSRMSRSRFHKLETVDNSIQPCL